jgi:hypothetical protein
MPYVRRAAREAASEAAREAASEAAAHLVATGRCTSIAAATHDRTSGEALPNVEEAQRRNGAARYGRRGAS